MPVDIPLNLEQLDYLLRTYGNKTHSDNLENLGINSIGDAIYVYSEKLIKSNVNNFMEIFKKYIPSFKQYFAVKALPNPHILKLLYDCGLGFDCSSISELKIVNELEKTYNIKCKKIFSSNYTSYEDIAYYFMDGITDENLLKKSNSILNLDDEDGLNNMIKFFDYLKEKNKELAKNLFPKLICFRYNPLIGATDSDVKSNVLGGSNTKFGISSDKILNVYQIAKNYGIKEFGIHVMTGSCILDINYFSKLLEIIYPIINELFEKLEIKIKFINLGGGIGIPYKKIISEINLEKMVENIYNTNNLLLLKYSINWKISIMMENGRYITGPYGWLITRCGSIKKGYDDKKFISLRACMSNLMRPGMYGAYHHITIPRLINNANYELVDVVGTLCENNDYFAKDRLLPTNIKTDDIVVIYDCGAHSHSMGFQYNGKLRCGEILFTDTEFKLIREGEIFENYISTVKK